MLRASYPIQFCDWENRNRPHKRTFKPSDHINGYNRIVVICISSCSRKNFFFFFICGVGTYDLITIFVARSFSLFGIPREMHDIMRLLWNIYTWVRRARFIVSLGYIVHPKEKLSFKKLWMVLSMHKCITPVRRSVVLTTSSYPYIHLWDV